MEENDDYNAVLVYTTKSEDKDLIDKDYLKEINEIEEMIKNISTPYDETKSYWNKVCFKDQTGTKNCSDKAFTSPMALFEQNDLNISDIEQVVLKNKFEEIYT